MAWKTERLGDLGQVVTGRTPPKAKPEMFGVDFPFLTPSDMGFMERTVQTERYLSHDGASGFERILLPAGSACFVCIGATIGKASITNETTFSNQQINSIIPDSKKADGAFIYYSVASNPDLLKKQAGGAATPIINKSAFSNIEIPLPPLPIQRRIAGILSAYDDLIEVNTRRIKALEEMARRTYEEWFVHYRFPGGNGSRPEGWELASIGSLFQTSSGGTPSRKKVEYFDGDIPWLKTKELLDGPIFETEEKITKLGLQKSSAKLFPPKTVIIAMYGATIGQLGVLLNQAATNQACCAILPTNDGPSWVFMFLTLLVHRDDLIDLRAGAAQQNINQGIVRDFEFVLPNEAVLRAFEGLVSPMLKLSFDLQQQNTNLRAQRDLLLPRLVSGAIDVSEAEHTVEAAAE